MAFGIIPVIVKFKHNAQKEFHRDISISYVRSSRKRTLVYFSLEGCGGWITEVAIMYEWQLRDKSTIVHSIHVWDLVHLWKLGKKWAIVIEWGTKDTREMERIIAMSMANVFSFFFTRFKRNTQNKNYGWKLKRSNFVVEKWTYH